MPDSSVLQSSTNNGTITPATPGSLTPTTHNLMVCVIGVTGTNPTITTPTGWTQVQKKEGGTLSFGMYILLNSSGAQNPSSALGGTVTGWVANQYEISQTAYYSSQQTLLGSAELDTFGSVLANIYASFTSPMQPQMLFVYSILRSGNTLTPVNTGGVSWGTSQRALSNVQTLSLDFFIGTNLPSPFGQYPFAGGILSASAFYVQIGAFFQCTATQPGGGDVIGGQAGQMVPMFYQGMIGG